METKETKMEVMNGYLLLRDAEEGSAIVISDKQAAAVGMGKLAFTSEQAAKMLSVETGEVKGKEALTIYYKAAEGLQISEEDLIAIPYSAVIAIKE